MENKANNKLSTTHSIDVMSPRKEDFKLPEIK
jgi:hypothetical protein